MAPVLAGSLSPIQSENVLDSLIRAEVLRSQVVRGLVDLLFSPAHQHHAINATIGRFELFNPILNLVSPLIYHILLHTLGKRVIPEATFGQLQKRRVSTDSQS